MFLLRVGSASKSNFCQYFNCVIKGNIYIVDFEIEKNIFFKCFLLFFIKGFNLILGSALVP